MKRILLAIALLAMLALPASALMIQLGLPTLTQGSDDVLVGRVTGMESRWDYDEDYIYTYVTLGVDRNLKGVVTESQAVLKVPGGEANGMVLTVEDMPYFEAGQQVLVFVNRDETGSFEVFGGFQGKYTVSQGRVEEAELPLDTFINQIKTAIPGK
jgi:hypothetical protein